jgi:hypothetical protein
MASEQASTSQEQQSPSVPVKPEIPLDTSQILLGRPNYCVTICRKEHPLNRRGEDLLVYCDNEQGIVTKKSKQVCQYLGSWYNVKYNPRRHLFALGEQYLELHNTDVFLPTEENAIAFAQAYFELEQTKEETSEESIEEELDINRHIRLTPIEPAENTRNMATQLQTAIAGTSGIQQAQQLPANPVNPAGQACLPAAPATAVAATATPESIKDIFD